MEYCERKIGTCKTETTHQGCAILNLRENGITIPGGILGLEILIPIQKLHMEKRSAIRV